MRSFTKIERFYAILGKPDKVLRAYRLHARATHAIVLRQS